MQYRKSLEIEARLETVLKLIRRGRYSTRGLAEEVGVSIPTISRCVQALRERGHEIRSESGEGGWRYVLVRHPKSDVHSGSGQLTETSR
jgi:predicted DNA-binding transcriptional regulator YafY